MVTQEHIRNLLTRNDSVGMHATGRALVRLMERQTQDEVREQSTRYHNTMGFTPADARMGVITAKYYLKHGRLEDWQFRRWRKPNKRGVPRICKYAGQLAEVAKDRQKETA